MMPAKSLTGAASWICGLILLGACARAPEPAGPSLPSVLFLSFDTCRADVFGALTGEEPSLTPHLDRLAADSVVFENAFVQMPHTLPSHMSMLTAVYPDVHGVKPDEDPLPESLVTLPEILQEAGYRTVGVVTSEWLNPGFGFGRGFDAYRRLPHRRTYADRVNEAALWHLRRERGPTFLFLHYYDLHSDFDGPFSRDGFPYYAPPRYREGLGVSSDGREFCDEEGNCNTEYLLAAARKGRRLPQAEIDTLHALYRAAVPHLDSQMGDFLEELRERGLYDGSLIVVTSDHGEEFHEHGRFIHSQPYDETVHVPLVVKFPDSWAAGTRVAELVETVDVLPTLLDYLGLSVPEQSQGESLLGLVEGEGERAEHAVLSQDTIQKSRYALRTDEVKLIADLAGGRRELYDLREDPGETVNLAAERAGLAGELEGRLKSLVEANRRLYRAFATGEGPDPDVLSEEERDRLESLGYVN